MVHEVPAHQLGPERGRAPERVEREPRRPDGVRGKHHRGAGAEGQTLNASDDLGRRGILRHAGGGAVDNGDLNSGYEPVFGGELQDTRIRHQKQASARVLTATPVDVAPQSVDQERQAAVLVEAEKAGFGRLRLDCDRRRQRIGKLRRVAAAELDRAGDVPRAVEQSFKHQSVDEVGLRAHADLKFDDRVTVIRVVRRNARLEQVVYHLRRPRAAGAAKVVLDQTRAPAAPEEGLAADATRVRAEAVRAPIARRLDEAALFPGPDERAVDEDVERPEPSQVLHVFADEERTGLQNQHPRRGLSQIPAELPELRGEVGTVHAGADDHDVERRRAILGGQRLLPSIAEVACDAIDRERRRLHVSPAVRCDVLAGFRKFL